MFLARPASFPLPPLLLSRSIPTLVSKQWKWVRRGRSHSGYFSPLPSYTGFSSLRPRRYNQPARSVPQQQTLLDTCDCVASRLVRVGLFIRPAANEPHGPRPPDHLADLSLTLPRQARFCATLDSAHLIDERPRHRRVEDVVERVGTGNVKRVNLLCNLARRAEEGRSTRRALLSDLSRELVRGQRLIISTDTEYTSSTVDIE